MVKSRELAIKKYNTKTPAAAELWYNHTKRGPWREHMAEFLGISPDSPGLVVRDRIRQEAIDAVGVEGFRKQVEGKGEYWFKRLKEAFL